MTPPGLSGCLDKTGTCSLWDVFVRRWKQNSFIRQDFSCWCITFSHANLKMCSAISGVIPMTHTDADSCAATCSFFMHWHWEFLHFVYFIWLSLMFCLINVFVFEARFSCMTLFHSWLICFNLWCVMMRDSQEDERQQTGQPSPAVMPRHGQNLLWPSVTEALQTRFSFSCEALQLFKGYFKVIQDFVPWSSFSVCWEGPVWGPCAETPTFHSTRLMYILRVCYADFSS